MVRVRAHNENGYGPYSSTTSDLPLETVPPALVDALSLDAALSTNTFISLAWDTPSEAAAGGSPATNYLIRWDQGSGTWEDLTTTNGQTADTTAKTVAGGSPYQFSITVQNKYGWGTESAAQTFYGA